MEKKEEIKNLSFEELKQYLFSIGEKAYRAKQIFFWLYQKNVPNFHQMTDLSWELRENFTEKFLFNRLKLIEKKISPKDQTQKFLFQLQDDNLIEAVLIPRINRLTACLSTQVGCRFRCSFCASGKAGFIRNLMPAEMVNQLLSISQDLPSQKITHVVFMGMGEPLDNYANLIKAIRIINHPYGFNIGARKITISSCGLPEEIKKLAHEKLQVELSVSLHAGNNELRSSLMPINKIFPLEKLIPACRQYLRITNRIITFEYVLMKGINDRERDIKEVIRLLSGLKCKINLILYNSFEGAKFCPPTVREAVEFEKRLRTAGIFTTLRQSKGEDINAACGQLRLKKLANYRGCP